MVDDDNTRIASVLASLGNRTCISDQGLTLKESIRDHFSENPDRIEWVVNSLASVIEDKNTSWQRKAGIYLFEGFSSEEIAREYLTDMYNLMIAIRDELK